MLETATLSYRSLHGFKVVEVITQLNALFHTHSSSSQARSQGYKIAKRNIQSPKSCKARKSVYCIVQNARLVL